jgi:iron(III) transport system substrate-binding protein
MSTPTASRSLINPLFEAFTAKTGIRVRTVFAENGLVERLAQEGRNSPADLLMTADVGRLVEAAKRDLAQPVTSPAILDKVPANLRDEGNQWFGLTMRARVIYASAERAKIDTITYEELADPKWKGKICMRPGNHPYNINMIAAMIAHKGEDATREWLKGLKANLAFKPAGNDRAQAKSVFAGECDLAHRQHLLHGPDDDQRQRARAEGLGEGGEDRVPRLAGFGTHVNISGVLLTARMHPTRTMPLKLMEFLASDEAQRLYADANLRVSGEPSGRSAPKSSRPGAASRPTS